MSSTARDAPRPRSIARLLALGGALGALLAGCLFPSFDDLKGDGGGAGDDDESDAEVSRSDAKRSSASSGSSSSSGDPGSSSSSSGGAPDGAPDTSAPTKKTIDCGGTICDLATQICCDEAGGGALCRPKDAKCTVWRFTCDDFTDCPEGQLCCKGPSLEIKCESSCSAGFSICSGDRPCKTGTCGSSFIGPPNVSVKVCN